MITDVLRPASARSVRRREEQSMRCAHGVDHTLQGEPDLSGKVVLALDRFCTAQSMRHDIRKRSEQDGTDGE